MGRGRGKGKKLAATSHEDLGSGGEEPVVAYRRRGRPQKILKLDIDDEPAEKIEDEDANANGNISMLNKDMKALDATENGRKRTKISQVQENSDIIPEENGAAVGSNSEESTKTNTNGFRQHGSRRKSKPRRAAEAGVECQ